MRFVHRKGNNNNNNNNQVIGVAQTAAYLPVGVIVFKLAPLRPSGVSGGVVVQPLPAHTQAHGVHQRQTHCAHEAGVSRGSQRRCSHSDVAPVPACICAHTCVVPVSHSATPTLSTPGSTHWFHFDSTTSPNTAGRAAKAAATKNATARMDKRRLGEAAVAVTSVSTHQSGVSMHRTAIFSAYTDTLQRETRQNGHAR